MDGCELHPFAPPFRNPMLRFPNVNTNKRCGFNHGFKVVKDFGHPQGYILHKLRLVVYKSTPPNTIPGNPGPMIVIGFNGEKEEVAK